MNWELCQVILDALNGETEEDIMVFLKRLYAGLGHTGLVEDAFQRMRRQEHLNEADVKISASRLWKVPTDSALLGDTYRYREVSSVESFRQPFSLHSCPSALYR